jgi:polyhydroxybutyrate depolymerase
MVNLPSRRRLLPAFTVLVLLLGLGPTASWAHAPIVEAFDGREMIVYVPSRLPPMGSRALVVVLHGGLGNAERIAAQQSEGGLNMDSVAEKNGFIVAYLNGTPATRFFGSRMLAWNAGRGCCGQPSENNVDDVAYIESAVEYLAGRYGLDRGRIYGIGHSNGAMMTQRLVCETKLYAAAVAISGPLNLETSKCSAAQGKRILAIHGADDQNVPVQGGRGAKGLSHVAYGPEDHARQVFINSGASYTLEVVPGADHGLDHIEEVILKTEGVTLAQKAAQFFGILK